MVKTTEGLVQQPLHAIAEFFLTGNCSFTKKHYLGREYAVRYYPQLREAAAR